MYHEFASTVTPVRIVRRPTPRHNGRASSFETSLDAVITDPMCPGAQASPNNTGDPALSLHEVAVFSDERPGPGPDRYEGPSGGLDGSCCVRLDASAIDASTAPALNVSAAPHGDAPSTSAAHLRPPSRSGAALGLSRSFDPPDTLASTLHPVGSFVVEQNPQRNATPLGPRNTNLPLADEGVPSLKLGPARSGWSPVPPSVTVEPPNEGHHVAPSSWSHVTVPEQQWTSTPRNETVPKRPPPQPSTTERQEQQQSSDEAATLRRDLNVFRASNEELVSQLRKTEADLASVRGELDHVRQQHRDTSVCRDDREQECKELNSFVDTLQQQLEESQRKFTDASREVKAALATVQTLQKEKDELKAKLQAAAAAVASANTAAQPPAESDVVALRQVASLKVQIAEYQAVLDRLGLAPPFSDPMVENARIRIAGLHPIKAGITQPRGPPVSVKALPPTQRDPPSGMSKATGGRAAHVLLPPKPVDNSQAHRGLQPRKKPASWSSAVDPNRPRFRTPPRGGRPETAPSPGQGAEESCDVSMHRSSSVVSRGGGQPRPASSHHRSASPNIQNASVELPPRSRPASRPPSERSDSPLVVVQSHRPPRFGQSAESEALSIAAATLSPLHEPKRSRHQRRY